MGAPLKPCSSGWQKLGCRPGQPGSKGGGELQATQRTARAGAADPDAVQREIIEATIQELEQFLADYPDSPWVPSLRANLGAFYRKSGRYGWALQHLEAAWQLTQPAPEGSAKAIADYALAHWTRLLAHLGRAETLAEILTQTQGRILNSGPLTQMMARTREAYRAMRAAPGLSFNCGVALLDAVGQRLGLAYDQRALLSVQSPPEGLSLKALADLARDFGLGLVPVARLAGQELVVPSVVHWRENHYGAIIGRAGDLFEVVDTTFAHRRFLTAGMINAEASGAFLIPANQLPADWQRLDPSEAALLVGRSEWNVMPDPNDHTCNKPCPPGCAAGSAGASGAGGAGSGNGGMGGAGAGAGGTGAGGVGGSGSDPGGSGDDDLSHLCDSCGRPADYLHALNGMTAWRVSEPYLNLWLHDQPLGYQPALGLPIVFSLSYKQRDETALPGVFQFGTGWKCSWLSHVETVYPDPPTQDVDVYLSGGGLAHFDFVNGLATNHYSNLRLRVNTSGGNVTSYELLEADGSKTVYDFFRTDLGGGWGMVFMSKLVDPQGHEIRLQYPDYDPATLIVRLRYVVDADGRTNTLSYKPDTVYARDRVNQVADPYGRAATLSYDDNDPLYGGLLQAITDAGTITSSFSYGPYWWPATLTTPYGQTSFTFQDQPEDPAQWGYRSCVITEPENVRQIYCYWNYAGPGTEGPGLPSAFSPVPYSPLGTLDNQPDWCTSFYWDRRQSATLPADPFYATTNDYLRGRLRHWLGTPALAGRQIDALSIQGDPSGTGTDPWQLTWFDYTGKPDAQSAGSQILPAVIARVMPDGTTWYTRLQRDGWGKPSNILEKWTANAQDCYRTNRFTYSSDGIDLLQATDANGNLVLSCTLHPTHPHLYQTRTEYPASGVSYTTTYDYDAFHRPYTVTSPANLLTTSYYGANNYLSARIDSISGTPLRTNSFTWLNATLYTHTSPQGLARTFTFDGLLRLTRIDYPDSTSHRYAYTNGAGLGLLDRTYVKDRLGFETRYAYDGLRRRVKTTDPRGNSTTYGYCDCGSPEYVTNALAQVTHYTYDNAGRNTGVYNADGTSRTLTYDALGRPRVVSDALGSLTNTYDNLSRVAAISNAFGQLRAVAYDRKDLPTSVTDANGATFTQGYDWLGRVLARTNAFDSGKEFFGYSPLGLTAYTNQLGSNVVNYAFDAAGRKTNEVWVGLGTNSFTYSPAGDLLTLTDGKSQKTAWGYDAYGQVTSKTNQANSKILTYAYDANGRLTNRWSWAKGTTRYTYDSAGNLTFVNYPVSPDITLGYDALNRVTNMVDAVGTTRYTYAAAGDLLTEDNPWSTTDTMTYSYHASVPHLRTGLTLQQPSGNWSQSYAYDAGKRLQTLMAPPGAFTYTYKGAGNLWTNLALPNNPAITNAYDGAGRLTGTYLKNSGGTVLNKHLYAYNLGSQRTNQTRWDGSSVTYAYDNASEIKTAVGTGGQSTEQLGYRYDAAWNLNQRTNSGSVGIFNVDVQNQLTTAQYVSYSYDGNGNLSSESPGRTFSYDDENQLTSVVQGTSYRSDWVYDGLGRLRKRLDYTWSAYYSQWLLSGETRYVYDGRRVIQERNGSNVPTVSYTRGNDLSGSLDGAGGIGGLLARSHGYSGGSWSTHSLYHADGNGNVTYLMDKATQGMMANYRYDPYGRTTYASDTLPTPNLYRFSSKETHLNSGLYYYGFRFYDPNLQRWLNRDPIGEWGGFNLYSYVGNSPIASFDPLGLDRYIYFIGHMWIEVDVYDDSGNVVGRKVLNYAPEKFWGNMSPDDSLSPDYTVLDPSDMPWPYQHLCLRVGKRKTSRAADEALLKRWEQARQDPRYPRWYLPFAQCWTCSLYNFFGSKGPLPPPEYVPPYSGGPVNTPPILPPR